MHINITNNAPKHCGIKRKLEDTQEIKLSWEQLSVHNFNGEQKLYDMITNQKVNNEKKRKNAEVFTPLKGIREMVNQLPKNVWTNSKYKWLEPSAGTGNFMVIIYYMLMDGLKSEFPIDHDRTKHIIENMLYMIELDDENYLILNQIFCKDGLKLNVHKGDSLETNLMTTFGVEKFDIIIGNPPYNTHIEHKCMRTGSLYDKHIEHFINKSRMLMFVVPSRWFACGVQLEPFKKRMAARTDIVKIKHFDKSCDFFGKCVRIEGGVNYFLKDDQYSGTCNLNGIATKLNTFDIILTKPKFIDIVNHLSAYSTKLVDILMINTFGITTNDSRLCNVRQHQEQIECHVSKRSGDIKYIDSKHMTKTYAFLKVLTNYANGYYECFGRFLIADETQVCSTSYIMFKVFTLEEAKSLISYLNCKLPNVMLSLRKNTQMVNRSSLEWIPLPPLNKIWTDKEVYAHYDLNEEQINLMETTELSRAKKSYNFKAKL